MEISGYVMFVVVGALPGLLLMWWGLAARNRPPAPHTTIPAAKIEDGSAFPASTDRDPRSGPRRGTGRFIGGILLAIVGGFAGLFLGLLADALSGMKFGRPLRVHGRPRRCRRARGTGWHDDARPSLEHLGAWKRAWLGERWLAAARAEHASVPAFQRLRSQLVAAGAPVALVHRCDAAVADEIRHARRCFALARAYSGIAWTAGALPRATEAPVDLSALAIESLVDGCIGEGVAADLARAGAERATDPVIRESLMMFANDEAAHAELAWAVVVFCIERGGPNVSRSVAAAARSVRAAVSPGPVDLARSEYRRIAAARISCARDRLATLMPVAHRDAAA